MKGVGGIQVAYTVIPSREGKGILEFDLRATKGGAGREVHSEQSGIPVGAETCMFRRRRHPLAENRRGVVGMAESAVEVPASPARPDMPLQDESSMRKIQKHIKWN